MTKRHVLMVGLAESGKTTFLAALWHLLNGDGVETALKLVGWPPERGYLRKIERRWLNCQVQERTKTLAPERAVIRLSNREGSVSGEVWFPDLSGEMFEGQWEDRRWSCEFDEILDAASGVLVFMHVEQVAEPVGIDFERELARTISDMEADEYVEEEQSDFCPWKPRMAPTQTIVVELLQLLQWRLRRTRLPIAVVLSAWDKVKSDRRSPDQWLVERLPLLAQFLESNKTTLPYHVYGVSAQGGDYDEQAHELAGHLKPWERVTVQTRAECSCDLTTIVQWVFGEI